MLVDEQPAPTMLSLTLLPLVLWVAARVAWQPHHHLIHDINRDNNHNINHMHNHNNKQEDEEEEEEEAYSDSECTVVSRVVMAAIFLLLFFIALV